MEYTSRWLPFCILDPDCDLESLDVKALNLSNEDEVVLAAVFGTFQDFGREYAESADPGRSIMELVETSLHLACKLSKKTSDMTASKLTQRCVSKSCHGC